jgi:hypothetical protein
MEHAAHDVGIRRAHRTRRRDTLQQLVQCVTVSEDVVRRFPVGEFIGGSKARDGASLESAAREGSGGAGG